MKEDHEEFTIAIKITELPFKFVVERVEKSGICDTILETPQRSKLNNVISDIQQFILNCGYFKFNKYAKENNIQIYEYKAKKPVWEYKE